MPGAGWMLQALWGPGCILHTTTTPCSEAVVHGLRCRKCPEKEIQDYTVPTKNRFPPEIGAGNLCPLGHCLSNSWSGSLWHGPAAVLASASGEPTGAGSAASHPPLIPNLPADVFSQSSPCTKAGLCSDTWHRNRLLGA